MASLADYRDAKRALYGEIFVDRRETLYCGCRFDVERRPDHASCGYRPARNPERAGRVEAEHVIPAAWIGQGRTCWREPVCADDQGRAYKGRKCCLRIDPAFRRAYNDLHNLWPVVGEINERRRHYRFGVVAGEPRQFGRCDFEVGADHQVEPREAIRGDVARIGLYMERTHGVWLSTSQRRLLSQWHRDDPPDAWEQERDRRIARIQGNRNPFVSRDQTAAVIP